MKLIKRFFTSLSGIAVNKPGRTLVVIGVITLVSIVLASHLEMRLNFKDLLPPEDPVVKSYQDVQDRFGEPNLVIALEGERNSTAKMADILQPLLEEIKGLRAVYVRNPQDFIRDHGFVLLKPNRFDRTLAIFSDCSMAGALKGLNDDFEGEYTDNEANLKRDEVEVARNLMGLHRALEIMKMNFAGESNAPSMTEAADAFSLGEPFQLSLDRKMLLISCVPEASISEDMNKVLETVQEVQTLVDQINVGFPQVKADLTGMAKIGQDELNSIGLYTQLLTLAALIIIYLLLVRSFRSWSYPLLALIPLIAGISWTLGLLSIIFGSLNLFTAMILLVLMGLGIDFSIHLISRFREELAAGGGVDDSVRRAISETGMAILTGALTTALSFYALTIADMKGIFEFGVAAGSGVLLTLLGILFTLPSLLVIHGRKYYHKIPDHPGKKARRLKAVSSSPTMNWIGRVAVVGWRHPWIVIGVTAVIAAYGIYSALHIQFEYDFLELEAKGLKSVELQREIPDRFGMSDHSAWLVTNSIEESRRLKEKLENKPLVGQVVSISDFIPSDERVKKYAPTLRQFRTHLLQKPLPEWHKNDQALLAEQINRLWDNLDFMSNTAFTAGLDRIVKVIDQMTGLDSETGTVTDSSAVLPALGRILKRGIDQTRAEKMAADWGKRLTTNVYSMADPSMVTVDDLPPVIRNTLLPRYGDGFLLNIFPRKYLYDKKEMMRFAKQTESVSDKISGTEKLFLLLMDSTLIEGRDAALLALVIIAILMLLHFRRPYGLIALLPLLIGTLIMLALMHLLGMKYNYMNFIAVPIILGIGIDDGVHVLHRFRHQRGDNREVRLYDSFRFVGRSIMLTSLTTMVGFGSVGFYEMRGMASFGQVLFMGVGACFIATLVVLPPMIRFLSGSK